MVSLSCSLFFCIKIYKLLHISKNCCTFAAIEEIRFISQVCGRKKKNELSHRFDRFNRFFLHKRIEGDSHNWYCSERMLPAKLREKMHFSRPTYALSCSLPSYEYAFSCSLLAKKCAFSCSIEKFLVPLQRFLNRNNHFYALF